ncbi:hypothetical protein [Pedobacter mendelii]|uniref:Uncharacterized protein n=1 Tax=Pedobacter mendelii TaxID=1908240 RepID=A0ABQ2BGJ6_9SPHI|nr:hypothetical protein [Pedobacter mendelii]GGI25696.1 hypothetical protein GCM10008119_18960 [Pedobacter mendelii]
MCFRETKNKSYLAQEDGIANFIISLKITPGDAISYWDYNDPTIPYVSRDTSAAADKILYSLSTKYVSKTAAN